MEEGIHSACRWQIISPAFMVLSKKECSLCCNCVDNILMFMNRTVVHDDDGVGTRIRFHVIKQVIDEVLEQCRTERAFNYLTMDDTVI